MSKQLLLLTINSPSWKEPIIEEVKGVRELVEYNERTIGSAKHGVQHYLRKERFLVIDHIDKQEGTERFRMWDDMTYTVELSGIEVMS